jgi:hypothetical protein
MRTLIAAAILAAAAYATPAAALDSYNCGYQIVNLGAPTTKLRSACGQPGHIVQLTNRLGAVVAERWEYERGRSLVQFVVQGGRVVRIEHIAG